VKGPCQGLARAKQEGMAKAGSHGWPQNNYQPNQHPLSIGRARSQRGRRGLSSAARGHIRCISRKRGASRRPDTWNHTWSAPLRKKPGPWRALRRNQPSYTSPLALKLCTAHPDTSPCPTPPAGSRRWGSSWCPAQPSRRKGSTRRKWGEHTGQPAEAEPKGRCIAAILNCAHERRVGRACAHLPLALVALPVAVVLRVGAADELPLAVALARPASRRGTGPRWRRREHPAPRQGTAGTTTAACSWGPKKKECKVNGPPKCSAPRLVPQINNVCSLCAARVQCLRTVAAGPSRAEAPCRPALAASPETEQLMSAPL